MDGATNPVENVMEDRGSFRDYNFEPNGGSKSAGAILQNYPLENSGVKRYRSQAACAGLPALPMRMRLVCLVGRVTPCAPSFRSRFTSSRENTATAVQLPPTISVRSD